MRRLSFTASAWRPPAAPACRAHGHSRLRAHALISRKDTDARRRFAGLYDIEFQPTSAKFDVVLDNTSYYDDSNDRRSDQLSKEFTELLLAAISRSPSSR